jgi:uncharacterized membrane protein HdeD (DUF308 family)
MKPWWYLRLLGLALLTFGVLSLLVLAIVTDAVLGGIASFIVGGACTMASFAWQDCAE